MVKRIMKSALVLLLAITVSTGIALAQHNHAAMLDQEDKSAPADLMKNCHQHASEVQAVLDKVEKNIAAARESKDLAKKDAALDEAQKQLAEAKQSLSMRPMMSGGAPRQESTHPMHCMEGMGQEQQDQSDMPQ